MNIHKTMRKTIQKQFLNKGVLLQGNFLFMTILWNNGQPLCQKIKIYTKFDLWVAPTYQCSKLYNPSLPNIQTILNFMLFNNFKIMISSIHKKNEVEIKHIYTYTFAYSTSMTYGNDSIEIIGIYLFSIFFYSIWI